MKKLPPDQQLEVVNSRVTIMPSSKAGGDNYWNTEQMIAQLRNAIKIANFVFPNTVVHWVFDNSSCHDSMPEDALCVTKMNVGAGGKQPKMRDTVIPANNPFGHGGKPQSLCFPDHLPDDHPHKKDEGQPKGMKIILAERGYTAASLGKRLIGDCGQCKARRARKVQPDPNEKHNSDDESAESEGEDESSEPVDCCMRRILSLQDDFAKQKCLLQMVVEEAGHICHFLPKFHPELNAIEYYWGWVKRYFRERTNGNSSHARKLLDEALDACPLPTIRRFFRRARRYLSVYELGATGINAEYAVKKYKSHRGVSQKDLDAAVEEREAKAAALRRL
uniref:Tc1-like transposase DDE domain-containing protein n=1 Tax=Mycena chlorophos TaxID=658473 RepID=A0ABQ0L565_MYCCL|nr:predicted protein [Mycena chlorophos]